MRILQNIGIENRLAAGNKGIPTNGEKRKSALSCCHFAFYQTLHRQGRAAKQRISSFKGSI